MEIFTVLTNATTSTNVQAGIVAAAVSALMGVFFFIMMFSIVVWLLTIIAKWLQFNKAGEAGWKALIPIYSDYIEAKLYWNTTVFWTAFAIVFILALISSFFQSSKPEVASMLKSSASFIGFVFNMALSWFQCKSFGKSTGFAILNMIPGISIITNFIIGTDSSQYIGNTTK